MVSLWPFRGDEKSAASFEKVLSRLSSKITKTSAQNELLRQHQRRYKALWTLYTTFAYILVAAILSLVTGWEKWGPPEYGALIGGPIAIFGVRTLLNAYYNYRISNSQSQLNDLIKQRESTLEQLKAATKYNSTQELLDKYGGSPKKPPQDRDNKKLKPDAGNSSRPPPVGRTGIAPPPTANIPGRQPQLMAPIPGGGAGPQTPPPQGGGGGGGPPAGLPAPSSGVPGSPSEEFAPNAFSPTLLSPSAPPSRQFAGPEGPKWYDRILDVVLGEDETQSRNRLVLICQHCRLVNGQAPPGTASLEEVGRWRCSSCHGWNGVESEEKRILKQISYQQHQQQASPPASPSSAVEDDANDRSVQSVLLDGEFEQVDAETEHGDEGDASASTQGPASATRSKARQT